MHLARSWLQFHRELLARSEPRITDVDQSNPQFDDGDQSPHQRCPQADDEKYPGAARNHLRNHRRGKGFANKIDDAEANEQNSCQHALKEKTDAWPAVGECRKQSLQRSAPMRS
jgi:hypothetical protein